MRTRDEDVDLSPAVGVRAEWHINAGARLVALSKRPFDEGCGVVHVASGGDSLDVLFLQVANSSSGEFSRLLYVDMPKKPELTDEDQSLRERIGATIRHVSAAKGVKPQELADAAGVSLAHQYRIEAGERTPDALYLFKACSLMGVSIDSLFADSRLTEKGSKSRRRVSEHTVSQSAVGDGNIQIGTVGAKARIKKR